MGINNDCMFSTLLLCDIKTILKCIVINKLINTIDTEYLWNLLYKRDEAKFIGIKSFDKYTLQIKYHKSGKWYNKYMIGFRVSQPTTIFIFDEVFGDIYIQ